MHCPIPGEVCMLLSGAQGCAGREQAVLGEPPWHCTASVRQLAGQDPEGWLQLAPLHNLQNSSNVLESEMT